MIKSLSTAILRITTLMFDELLKHVTPYFKKKLDTSYGKALEPGIKLAINLCHIATGDSCAMWCLKVKLGSKKQSI